MSYLGTRRAEDVLSSYLWLGTVNQLFTSQLSARDAHIMKPDIQYVNVAVRLLSADKGKPLDIRLKNFCVTQITKSIVFVGFSLNSFMENHVVLSFILERNLLFTAYNGCYNHSNKSRPRRETGNKTNDFFKEGPPEAFAGTKDIPGDTPSEWYAIPRYETRSCECTDKRTHPGYRSPAG